MDIRRKQPMGVELVKRGIVKESDIENALDYQRKNPDNNECSCSLGQAGIPF